jgi:hypothetical protein
MEGVLMRDVKSDKLLQIYEYLTYLSSSAQGLFLEPKEYGPLRCVDAMRRFINVVIGLGIIEGESSVKGLEELKERLEKGVTLLMYSPEKFKEFVTELNIELARKVSKLLDISLDSELT